MSLTIDDGGSLVKDPSDEMVLRWDWDDHLDTGVIISTSTWTIDTLKAGSSSGTALAYDNASIVSAAPYNSQSTQVRITDGAIGGKYRLTNTIVTDETPAQTFERSVMVIMEQR